MDWVVGCRRLVQGEGILAGGSSGGVLMAVEQVKERISRDATCVVIFPDRGERYLLHATPERCPECGIMSAYPNSPACRR